MLTPPSLHEAAAFAALGLGPALAQACSALGYTEPTPVQAGAIPAILSGADTLACAQTGSGKTAAFGLPLLQKLMPTLDRPGRTPVRALVLVPTRELALQVAEVLRQLVRHLNPALPRALKVALAHGGVSINPQMLALRGGADVVVATPGRLLDLVQHGALGLATVELLVLDEADRLLDLGFADELDQVLVQLPRRRQNVFLSATFPPSVNALANELLHEPVNVRIDAPAELPLAIEQHAFAVDAGRRTALLRHLITTQGWQQVLVFVASQYAAEHVAYKLLRQGLRACAFHGGLGQGARQQALDGFKSGHWDVLVTTDLASRGLDIDRLPVVVNYDLPRSVVDYVHRIGRTGRAGAEGVAVSLVTAAAQDHWRLIARRQGLDFEVEQLAGFEPTETEARTVPAGRTAAAPGTGGIKGRRPSKKDKLRAAQAASQAGKDR